MKTNFPEPFKTAIEKYGASIDYKVLPGKSDHTWLEKHGYLTSMNSDCSMGVFKNGQHVAALSASSYGWGTYYSNWDKNNEVLKLLVDMYNEGIISLWRIRIYGKGGRMYDFEDGRWTTPGETSWVTCESPIK